ncbi:GNAT family N-acetyltransferase [Acinetobacter indicus]|uniref:GNAT family N-acetyltransferase n=1 Tax=Acinetobacter indicus TaxID=756892 RepID=UPI001443DBD5|nr:GNAT family N-acetyltransferase [Acinetobacter indicus]
MSQISIHAGSWQDLQADAKVIREQVFIQEQQIAPEDEWDAQDAVALHFVVYIAKQAIATARLLENHSIGRVAVLKSQRGLGVGRVLMQHIIQMAKQQQRPWVKLSAQEHAIPFYQSLGFQVEGESYLDCGIAHVDMHLVFES